MNRIFKKKRIFPVLFLSFFIVISVFTFMGPKSDYSVNEKRYYAKFPDITFEGILSGEFQERFEEYVCDHIFGRNLFVGINSYFTLWLGRNTVSDIYNCKDGYLINAPKGNDISVFEKNIKNFNGFSAMTGLPSTLFMVPTTGYIMEDKLPLLHAEYNDDYLYKLAAENSTDMGIIDPRRALISECGGAQLYYRTDHHLTSRGNYIMYNLFCSVNGMACPDESQYKKSTYSGFYGSTWSGSGYWLTPPDKVELWDIGDDVTVTISEAGREDVVSHSLFFTERINEPDKYPVFLDGNHTVVKIENPSAPEGVILVIKDSYAQCFSVFLSHSYKTVYMIDLRYYRGYVSEFAAKNNVDEILYMYGMDTLLTDSSSVWLN